MRSQSRKRRPFKLILSLALLFLFANSGFAQKGKKTSSVALAPKFAKMSNKAKLSTAKRYIKNIKRVHSGILGKLEAARQDKDLPATECLGEKLTAARALLFLAERSNLNLQEAIAKNDSEKVGFHFTKIVRSEYKTREVEVEAKLCRGKAGIYSGKTKVIVTRPPDLGSGDPTLPPWKEPIIYRPINASSFF